METIGDEKVEKVDTNTGIGAINPEFNFWGDAIEFIKTIVHKDAEKMIAEHIKERGFNDNEMRFFREYLKDAFDMYAMMSYLKHF